MAEHHVDGCGGSTRSASAARARQASLAFRNSQQAACTAGQAEETLMALLGDARGLVRGWYFQYRWL